jgi:hypothetical protein
MAYQLKICIYFFHFCWITLHFTRINPLYFTPKVCYDVCYKDMSSNHTFVLFLHAIVTLPTWSWFFCFLCYFRFFSNFFNVNVLSIFRLVKNLNFIFTSRLNFTDKVPSKIKWHLFLNCVPFIGLLVKWKVQHGGLI